MKTTKTLYIVAPRSSNHGDVELWEFKTKKARQGFIDECLKRDNTFEYATTEKEVSDDK